MYLPVKKLPQKLWSIRVQRFQAAMLFLAEIQWVHYRAWNNFPAEPVKLSGQTCFWSDITRFQPDKYLSSRIIWLHFTVKYMWTIIKILYNTTHALLNLRWRLYRGQSNDFLPRNSRKMRNDLYPRRAVLLKFRAVAEPRNSGKSANFGRNLNKDMSVQHIWDLSRLIGLFLP